MTRLSGLSLLLPVLIYAEECEDSAYIQRQAPQETMTPRTPSLAFIEAMGIGTATDGPEPLQCGAGDMYAFGKENQTEPQCSTVTSETPFAGTCTVAQFNDLIFESTCWWPYQQGSDYCADTFEGSAINQVTLEGIVNDSYIDPIAGNGKTVCFTAMPVQICPKYVCVSSGGLERYCYSTAGKTCKVVDGNAKSGDSVECEDWSVKQESQTFCIASLSEEDQIGEVFYRDIRNFAIQWECCSSGGSTGDPHIRTMDNKHYTLLQEGTFKLWSLSNYTTEYITSEQQMQETPQLQRGKVDWEIYVHYATGHSFSKGLLLVDKSLGKRRQALELTSETCRWRSKLGEDSEWTQVDQALPVFMPEGADFVTGFNLTRAGRKNGDMNVQFMMNTKYGVKRVASLKIACKSGHHIDTKLRLDKSYFKQFLGGEISPGRDIISDKSKDMNISQTLTAMRRMSSLQVMRDQEYFVDEQWEKLGGSNEAAFYLKEVDEQIDGAFSLVTTCSPKEEEAAKQTCVKWMGKEIVNASGARHDAFTDCIFDVCAGGGEASAELASEMLRDDDF